jgi:hypothetical protein
MAEADRREYWLGVVKQSIQGFAQGVLAALVIGWQTFDKGGLPWLDAFYIGLGCAVIALLLALGGWQLGALRKRHQGGGGGPGLTPGGPSGGGGPGLTPGGPSGGAVGGPSGGAGGPAGGLKGPPRGGGGKGGPGGGGKGGGKSSGPGANPGGGH